MHFHFPIYLTPLTATLTVFTVSIFHHTSKSNNIRNKLSFIRILQHPKMKWGRNTPSPPSFGSSVITRVFPGSWFSKFKQTGGGPDAASVKKEKQQRGKLDFSTVNSSLPGCRQARFYRLDDDAYWTLSFRKDRGEGRRRNGSARINPLWYESDDDYLVAVSSSKSSGLRETQLPRRELESICEIDANEMKQDNILHDRGAQLKKEKKNVRRSRKLRARVERKKQAEFRDEGENEEEQLFPTEVLKEESQDSEVSNSRNNQNFGLSSDGEDYAEGRAFADPDGEGSTATSERPSTIKCQNLESMKFEEIKVKTEFQEESAYIGRRSRSRKVRQKRKKARGSRSECRIHALKGMKKERMKLKEEKEEEEEEEEEAEAEAEAEESSTIYNSFAVVKRSFNPQQDFRDSMMEMIKEKGIRRREELQELLACYLTLNCDGHHNLIINVFQQVWFEITSLEE